MKLSTIKAKADVIQSLSDLTEGTMLYKIAKAMINAHGYYTYTQMQTNEKCFVSWGCPTDQDIFEKEIIELAKNTDRYYTNHPHPDLTLNN